MAQDLWDGGPKTGTYAGKGLKYNKEGPPWEELIGLLLTHHGSGKLLIIFSKGNHSKICVL